MTRILDTSNATNFKLFFNTPEQEHFARSSSAAIVVDDDDQHRPEDVEDEDEDEDEGIVYNEQDQSSRNDTRSISPYYMENNKQVFLQLTIFNSFSAVLSKISRNVLRKT